MFGPHHRSSPCQRPSQALASSLAHVNSHEWSGDEELIILGDQLPGTNDAYADPGAKPFVISALCSALVPVQGPPPNRSPPGRKATALGAIPGQSVGKSWLT